MADPRLHGPQTRSANHSDLMRAILRSSEGEVVNACPFGCKDNELDHRTYCRHLVGFTIPGSETQMTPLAKVVTALVGDDGKRVLTEGEDWRVDGTKLLPVLKGDQLRRITVSHRVYRNVDAQQEEIQPEDQKAKTKKTAASAA